MSKKLILIAALLAVIASLAFAATKYDRCEMCGDFYGPGLLHLARHIAVPSFWK